MHKENTFTISDIASHLSAKTVVGEGSTNISIMSGTADIAEGSIVCASDKKSIDVALNSECACIVVSEELKENNGKNIIVVENSMEAFVKLLSLFFKEKEYPLGTIESSAVISKTATISKSAYISHNVVIAENATVGDNTVILSNVVVGDDVVIGSNCKINANVVLHSDCILKDNVIIGSASVIGGDGFGYYDANGKHNKIPQRGNVIIYSDVEIGSGVMIDRAVIGSTIIGNGVKVDNLVHIAHNCSIGDNSLIVAQVGIAGSSKIGNWCTLAGQVGIGDHAEIEDKVIIAAQGGIMSNVKVPSGSILFGSPAQDIGREKLAIISYRKLPELVEEVEALTGKRIRSKK